MRRHIVIGGGLLGLGLLLAAWGINYASRGPDVAFETPSVPPVASPLCPWRDPDADMKAFFPGANRYEVKTHILSSQRVELARRLGRAPTGDENALRLYPVYHDATPLGVIMTRRVKGASGAIEMVLAVGMDQRICGVRLQRMREQPEVAAALENTAWLRGFSGRCIQDPWAAEKDETTLPAEARDSAGAVINGMRSLLVLLDTADQNPGSTLAATHH